MEDTHLQSAPTEDTDWAFDVVQDVSRTFALTIDELTQPLSTWICTGYLLCRVADTVEDASHIPPETREELLNTYGDVLDESAETDAQEFVAAASDWIPEERSADWAVVEQTQRVVRVFDSFDASVKRAMRPVVVEMAEGMAMFIQRYADDGGLRIQTISELEEYCWYVAGTVGEMITNLVEAEFDIDPAVLRENEQDFALLLQLVNVAKDVPDDYRTENNVYLPSAWLAEEDVEPDGVTDDQNTAGVATVVSRVASRARGYTDGAYRYLLALPSHQTNIFEAFSIPYLLAIGTLRELEDNAEAVTATKDDVKVSRDEVFALLSAVRGDFTKDDLTDLRSTMRTNPLHLS